MKKYEYLSKQLEELRENAQFRSLTSISDVQYTLIRTNTAFDTEKILFCSNNYLNLAQDSRIIKAGIEAIKKYGFGSGASRLISGTLKPHTDLEQTVAQWLGKERGLYLPSGWMANQALLTCLPQKGDLVLSDRLNHASIIDAIRTGPADFRTYRRGQSDRIKKYLENSKYNSRFIVTETIFSMDGDCPDLTALVDLKNRYNAILILDEAHGLGCFGSTGAGWAEHQNLLHEADIIVAPLGKAAASSGAIIAGPTVVIEYLINKARPFIYTTAPSASCAAAAMAAVKIMQTEPDRRHRLQENADYLRGRLRQIGIDTGQSTSQIVPAIIGDSEKTLHISRELDKQGFFIPAIRSPTVPPGTARLRISLQCNHTKAQMDHLCSILQTLIH